MWRHQIDSDTFMNSPNLRRGQTLVLSTYVWQARTSLIIDAWFYLPLRAFKADHQIWPVWHCDGRVSYYIGYSTMAGRMILLPMSRVEVTHSAWLARRSVQTTRMRNWPMHLCFSLWCLRDCFALVIRYTVLFSGRVEISDSTTLHFNMNALITSGHNTATRVAMDYGQQKGQNRIRM